ncbi:glycoside hydrolase family protein, partial [Bacteroides xylanisolvens]
MKRLFYTLLFFLPCMLIACGGSDDTPDGDNNPPVVAPPCEEPVDSRLLYNGIRLPEQWPPVRSSSSELEKGMSPFYLSDKPSVINISVGRQLFVDNFLIESTNLKRTFYYPEYYSGNPILTPEQDWEKTGTKGAAFAAPFSDGVWYDEKEGKYKMWYMAGGGSYATSGAGVTCYAESTDGIHWTKPTLSVVAGTNIVDYNSERDASVIWLDKQESNASKRYKMFLVARESGKWRYHYKTSPDGKVWRAAVQSEPIADRSTVYKNPFRNVWVYSMRHNVRVDANKLVRARDYNENTDPEAGTKKAEALLSAFWFGPWANEQHHTDYPNIAPAIYNQDATPYESIMLGFFSVWQGPENDVCASDNVIKRNQVMVGYSRDGYSWFREDMNPFHAVNTTTSDAWNQGNLQSVAGAPLIVGDKLYFYLSGRRLRGTQE